MIDGMITATAVAATMPLIHNNAGDFASFRSAIWRTERFPNVGLLAVTRKRIFLDGGRHTVPPEGGKGKAARARVRRK